MNAKSSAAAGGVILTLELGKLGLSFRYSLDIRRLGTLCKVLLIQSDVLF